MATRAPLTAAFLPLVFLAACGREPVPPPPVSSLVLVTEVPERAAEGLVPIPSVRYPPGSRLLLLDPQCPREVRTLSDGLLAAGGATVDPRTSAVLFTGKAAPGEPYRVYACRPDGGERRVVVAGPGDRAEPACLSDGRVACAAVQGGRGPGPGAEAAWGIAVGAGDGGDARAITFGAGFDADPSPLADGRMVYAAWLPQPQGSALFTVHVDGTGSERLPGGHTGEPFVLRPRQTADGDIVYVRPVEDGARGGSPPTGSAWRADHRSTARAPRRVAEPLADVRSVEPDGADGLLVAGRSPQGVSGVWHTRAGETTLLLAAPAGRRYVHAAFLRPPSRPRGHLSVVDPSRASGQVLALDARGVGDAARARLTVLDGPFAAGLRPAGRVLGEVVLADDGSFFVQVPADRPLLLDLLAADGTLEVAGRTPFWVRPGEVRACVGCHEDPETAPENRRPDAVLAGAVDLTRTGEEDE